MIKQLDYWYDRQMPRFLEQVVRAFSGFQYQTGQRILADGTIVAPQLKVVPCSLALSSDRTIGHILRNNSENTTMATPRITVSHTGLAGRRTDLQNTSHVSSLQVRERQFDEATRTYEVGASEAPTRSYTVERLMPRPFEMQINLDIWTSNQDQKYQLLEQILTVVYPDFAIQNSDTAVDWSALTFMEVTDISLSSRSIPVGTDSEIDIATVSFRIPMWLSPPAKVMQQRRIEQIITNVHDARHDEDATEENTLFQNITTPGDHQIEVSNGMLKLLGPKGSATDEHGEVYDWKTLLNLYGRLRPTLSTIRLKTTPEQIDDWSNDIIGTIQYDTSNPNLLFWQLDPDTLPTNTQPPILGVVNPLRASPGYGLPSQVNGQRYLVTADLGPSAAWGNVTAHENDIIEYVGGQGVWRVTFSPERHAQFADFVLNLTSGRQLRWDGEDWVLTIDGTYAPGYWRLRI